MKISHLALACAVAFGGSAALAQNEAANSSTASNGQPSQSASELGNKAKSGIHSLGEKTRNAFNKLRGKSQDATAKSDAKDDTRAMGAGKATASRDTTAPAGSDTSGSRQKRMDEAYSDYKQGKK